MEAMLLRPDARVARQRSRKMRVRALDAGGSADRRALKKRLQPAGTASGFDPLK
jgi:hypothetical protein